MSSAVPDQLNKNSTQEQIGEQYRPALNAIDRSGRALHNAAQ